MDAGRFRTHSLRDASIARILAAGINAVEPGKLVLDYLQKADLPKCRRVFLLGIGKASVAMTQASAEFFSDFSKALIITKHAPSQARQRMTVLEGGHPLPDKRSIAAGQSSVDFVSNLEENDLLVCLISGGGSALVTAPNAGITLEDIQAQTTKLLANGSTIQQINALRQKMDHIKGGGLVRATKAKVISLILSDVIGNSLETIASGLTVDPALGQRVQNVIVGDIRVAAQAAQRQAAVEGFASEILGLQIQSEVREAGSRLAKRLKKERQNGKSPFCLIAGGETTVTVKGNGTGGRNQELALAAVDELGDIEDILFVSLATDGDDGPTDAAGAVVNGETRRRAQKLGMSASDYLARNDAYNFFDPLSDLIQCGYTGTNVNDLIFLIGF
ncbi:MAG TPA: DUF4147 domain-containing protein [Anaerolineales bacterium]|nr:DUF4147 domain-containing protein [Anaerolineales bacterium]